MYKDFYRFAEKPFEDVLNPKFFYRTPAYQKMVTSLLAWVRDGHGFAVITGEAGTGKTLFIQSFLSSLGEKTKSIVVPNPAATFKELLKQLFWSLGQPVENETRAALLHRFMKYLKQFREQGDTLLVVLDECQDLSDQVLEDVQHFLGLKSKPIRAVLVGQPDLTGNIEAPGLLRLRQGISLRLQMKPLTEEETRQYLAFRLHGAGGNPELFTPKAVSLLYRYTRGIPSLINHVCDNALRLGYTHNQRRIDADLIEETIRNLDGPGTSRKIFSPSSFR